MSGDPYLIKLVGGVERMKGYPELLEHVGRYVQNYEPWKAPRGEQWIWTTDDLESARAFDDVRELYDFYEQSIGTRADGKPNRPITAYHVQVARGSQFEEDAT